MVEPTHDAAEDASNPAGPRWLTREQFLGLARRCHLEGDRDLLQRLARDGYLPVVHTEAGPRYAPAHLWLLARYLDHARVLAHPWADPPKATDPRELEPLKADARSLVEVLGWLGQRERSKAPPDIAARLAHDMDLFVQRRSPLGPLRAMIPLLHAHARAGMRGAALLTELLAELVQKLRLLLPPLSTRTPDPDANAEFAGMVQTLDAAEHPSLASHVGLHSYSQDESPSFDASADPSFSLSGEPSVELPLGKASARDSGERPTRKLDTLKARPMTPTGGGLKEALARAKAANQARRPSAEALEPDPDARPTVVAPTVAPFEPPTEAVVTVIMELPAEVALAQTTAPTQASAEVAGPTVEIAQSPAPSPQETTSPGGEELTQEEVPALYAQPAEEGDAATFVEETSADLRAADLSAAFNARKAQGSERSLEQQVQELNEQRQEYIRTRKWDKLVALYLERMYLFPSPQERRQIYNNIGALYEHKLKRLDQAYDAYRQAFEALPGDRAVYDALMRLAPREAHPHDALRFTDAMLSQNLGADERLELSCKRAELLAATGKGAEGVALCRELLGKATEAQRAQVLASIYLIAREHRPPGAALLELATALELLWGADPQAERLVGFYQDLFGALLGRDQATAAELMSRLASTFQAQGQFREAFVALGQALSCDPERVDLFARLESLAERLNVLRELAAMYESEFDRVLGQGRRALLARRLALIYDRLGDRAGQRRAWLTLVEAEPFDAEALRRLAGLQQEEGDWSGWLDTLRRLREQAQGEERVQLSLQIARLCTEGLLDPDSPAARAVDVDGAVQALQGALEELDDAGSPLAQGLLAFVLDLIARGSRALALQLGELVEPFLVRHEAHAALVELYEQLIDAHLRSDGGEPEAARLLLQVAKLQDERLGQPQQALLQLGRALRLDPDSEPAHEQLRALAQRLGQWDDVAALYDELLESPRLLVREPWLRRAARLQADRHHEDAAYPYYEALHAADPNDLEALEFLERYAQERRLWERLVDILEARARAEGSIGPRRDRLAHAAAVCLEHVGDEGRALGLLRQALTVDPEDAALLDRILPLYASGGRWEELGEFLTRQEELARDPQVRARLLLAQVKLFHERLGRRAESLKALDKLHGLRPHDPEVLGLMEALYTKASGREQDAYRALAQRCELLEQQQAPEDERAEAWERLVDLAGRADDPAGLERACRRLLKLRPQHATAMAHLDKLFEEQRRWPDLIELLEARARAMHERKHHAAAAALLERAVEVARDEMKDERRELALLQRLAVFQERPDLSQVERRLALARKLQDWVASLQANEDFISLLDDPEDSAAVLVEMASVARERLGDASMAANYLERAVDACPHDRLALVALADILRGGPDRRRLAEVLRALLLLDGGVSPEQSVRYALELGALTPDPRSAVEALELALPAVERFGEVIAPELQDPLRRRLADLHQALGQDGESLGHLEELQRAWADRDVRGEEMARLCEQMGAVALRLGLLEDAERHCLNALAEAEEMPKARLLLAQVHVQRERWNPALEVLEPLSQELARLESPEQRGLAMALLGQTWKALGQQDQATEAFRAALDHDPRNGVARGALGV